jgi:hypothetical protein
LTRVACSEKLQKHWAAVFSKADFCIPVSASGDLAGRTLLDMIVIVIAIKNLALASKSFMRAWSRANLKIAAFISTWCLPGGLR